MDWNKVFDVVAVALAVPLSVAANLLTPRIRDWYSTTTQRRLRKRLSALEQEYEDVENEPLWSRAEAEIFKTISFVGLDIVFLFTIMFTIPQVAVIAFNKVIIPVDANHYHLIGVFCDLGSISCIILALRISS